MGDTSGSSGRKLGPFQSMARPPQRKPVTKKKNVKKRVTKTTSGSNPNVIKLFREKGVKKQERKTWKGYAEIDKKLFPQGFLGSKEL